MAASRKQRYSKSTIGNNSHSRSKCTGALKIVVSFTNGGTKNHFKGRASVADLG